MFDSKKIIIEDLPMYPDERGYLSSIWNETELGYKEDRISRSYNRVLRGFHGDSYTSKLCICLHGAIRLVAWDIKRQEKTDILLNDLYLKKVYIPPYFLLAHQCLSETCVLLYKWTERYNGPQNQYSVRYSDPTINVDWSVEPILSERDKNSVNLCDLKL